MGNSNSNSNDGAVAGAGAGAAGGEQKTAQQGPETEVFLNVYQPKDPNQAQVPGFGVYHSGLEVFGTEYTYAGAAGSGTGVYSQRVKWQVCCSCATTSTSFPSPAVVIMHPSLHSYVNPSPLSLLSPLIRRGSFTKRFHWARFA